MASLTVGNLDDETVRALRVRAAEHGRSAEAEHRAILQAALTEDSRPLSRAAAAERLAEFRRRTGGRDSASTAALLEASRRARAEEPGGSVDG